MTLGIAIYTVLFAQEQVCFVCFLPPYMLCFTIPKNSPSPKRILYESLVSETEFTVTFCYLHEMLGGTKNCFMAEKMVGSRH